MAMTTSVRDHYKKPQALSNHMIYPRVENGLDNPNYETANHWSELSVSYSQLGDREAALDARQKAVEVYRLLHAKRPELFEGNLARELLGLSKDLAGSGLIEDAFKASQESGMLYRHILGLDVEHNQIQRQGYWGITSTRMAEFVQSLVQIPKLILCELLSSKNNS